jgi:hypothetical protein
VSDYIAQNYNDPSLRAQMLSGNTVGVSESEASVQARRANAASVSNLVQGPNPSFNVVQGEYVVPKDGYKINAVNADTFFALYEAVEMKPGDRVGEDLKLVNPAKVSLNSDGSYQVVEKGRFVAAELYQQQSAESARVLQSDTQPELDADQRQYLQLLNADPSEYSTLKEQAVDNPDQARRLDQAVVEAAYQAKVDADDITRIVRAGPYVRTMREQSTPENEIKAYIAPIESAYRNRELNDMRRSLTDQLGDAARTAYQTLYIAEKAVFSITPFPLNALKNGIQQVGFPLMATGLAAQLPGAHQVISTAISFAGNVASYGMQGLTSQGMSYFGTAFMSHLPSGLGLHTMANGLGSAFTPMANIAADKGGQLLGQAGSAVMMGNAMLQGGRFVFSQIAEKGIRVTFSDTWAKGKHILARTESLIETIKTTTANLKGNNMAINNGNQPDISATQAQNTPSEPPRVDQSVEQEVVQTVAPPLSASTDPGQTQPSQPATVGDQNPPTPPIKPSDAAEEALPPAKPLEIVSDEYVLSVAQQLSQRGINIDRLQVDFGKDKAVFSMREGNLYGNRMTSEQVEMLRTALNDPANLKGTVRITQGGKTLVHVMDGKLIEDRLGIVKQAAKIEITPETPSQLLYQQASKGVESKGARRVEEIASNAFRSGANRQEVKEALKAHDETFKGMSPTFQNQTIDLAQSTVGVERQPQQAAPVQEKVPGIAR